MGHRRTPRQGQWTAVAWPAALLLALVYAPTAPAGTAEPLGGKLSHGGEVYLTAEEYKRLDTFEAHSITKGDKAFDKRNWPQAAAEYNSFVLEFERSPAVPYALLRRARSLHLFDKRYEAIKEYQQVLDYFPNAVKYAAAAQYYIGAAHWENGHTKKALDAWAELAKDEDYSRQPLAAGALLKLADRMASDGRDAQAVKAYWDVAVFFRELNGSAAREAIEKVTQYYTRAKGDQEKLQEFYRLVRGFGERPGGKVPDDLSGNPTYWATIRHLIARHGSFEEKEQALHDRYYRYWSSQLAGRFPDSDDHQIFLAGLYLKYERDPAKWAKRLSEHFKAYQKAGDYDRILRWMSLFAHDKQAAMSYYAMLAFDKMTNEQLIRLMWVAYVDMKDEGLGTNTFHKIRLREMTDRKLAELARSLWRKALEQVQKCCDAMQDQDFAGMELLKYFYARRDVKRGLLQADKMMGVPDYAADATWIKASLLEMDKKYLAAIDCYKECTKRAPDNLWRIADCYARIGKLKEAVVQLQEVEAFFPPSAAEAAYRIGRLFDDAGKREHAVAWMHRVLTKYEKSNQSSDAHNWLESRGYKIIRGGTDVDKK